MTLPKCIYSNVFLHEVLFYDFLWFTDLIYLIVYFETCTVYICTPIYSRILAYWLMLSVLQTTENKFYLILSYLNHTFIVTRPRTTVDFIVSYLTHMTLHTHELHIDQPFSNSLDVSEIAPIFNLSISKVPYLSNFRAISLFQHKQHSIFLIHLVI